jgi:hypothetical protein
MVYSKCCAILLLLFIAVATATAYKAGVLEYNPRTSDSPINTIVKNLEEFRFYADKARTQVRNVISKLDEFSIVFLGRRHLGLPGVWPHDTR